MTAVPPVKMRHLHDHLALGRVAWSDGSDAWRWEVRRLLRDLRDLLLAESPAAYDGWLAARGDGMLRERTLLLTRLSVVASHALHEPTVERVRDELGRLLVDADHHLQRRRDLAWDEVELELGGSE